LIVANRTSRVWHGGDRERERPLNDDTTHTFAAYV
jgi:hypothetical protein